jgi:FemAB-related protein (PEP-CTERM system-associated)
MYNNIKVKLADDSDQKRWDDFVLAHPESSPYHLFAWKKAVESAYCHKCQFFIAEHQSDILGILPLTHIRFSFFVDEVVSLPFCDIGGCLSKNEKSREILFKKVASLFKNGKTKKIQIRSEISESDASYSGLHQLSNQKVRMLLNLPNSSNVLFDRFKSKLRSQIRKAEKNDITFRWGNATDIDEAYRVFSINMHELGSPVHSKSFLAAVLSHFGKRAKLGLVEFQENIVGMGVILLGSIGVSIPWASTLRAYNRLSPNMLLYWNFLKFASDNGFSIFDFGRSTENEGTYKFKKQWGTEPVPLVWYESIDKRSKNEISNPTSGNRDLLAAAWRKMPLPLANAIGPYFRKYISL